MYALRHPIRDRIIHKAVPCDSAHTGKTGVHDPKPKVRSAALCAVMPCMKIAFIDKINDGIGKSLGQTRLKFITHAEHSCGMHVA